MAFKTWEQIGRESRAKMRRMPARFASVCPQCKRPIAVGDTIIQPWVPNRHKGNQFYGCWYCEDCGEFTQRGVDCGYLANNGPFLTRADKEAFDARSAVVTWLEESRRRQNASKARGDAAMLAAGWELKAGAWVPPVRAPSEGM